MTGSWRPTGLDDLERRYARIYPLATLARITLQFFATLVVVGSSVVAGGIVLAVVMASTGSPNAHALALGVASMVGALVGMCVGGSYWILLNLIGRMSKLAALGWIIIAVLAILINVPSIISVFDFFADSASADATQVALALCLLALYAYFIWLAPVALLRGSFAALSASKEQANVMRETVTRRLSFGKALSTLLGLPPLAGFIVDARARVAKIVVLTALSGLLLTSVPLGILALPSMLSHAYVDSALNSANFFALIILLPLGAAGVLLVLSSIGREFERAQLRSMRFSLEELQKVDGRPPVLFLRAFADDQVDLPEPSLSHLGKVLDYGRRRTNLDQMLLEEGTPYGPVVALGNPNDVQPPYGAARGYFEHKTWQQAVQELVQMSRVVILCLDASEGVWWEVEHLAAAGQLPKTLILVHPLHAPVAANAQLLASLASKMAAAPRTAGRLREIASNGGQDGVVAVTFDNEGLPDVCRSGMFSRFTYLLAVRSFMRARLGLPS